MNESKGVMTIAEGMYDYRVDVNLVLDGGRRIKKHVLRTTMISLGVWKSKYAKNASPFNDVINGVSKEAAVIDGEVWVFGIDATLSSDIVIAVTIAKNHFKVSAKDIIGDVYVKNLNVERDNEMEAQAKIFANKKLYSTVSTALVDAAKKLGISGNIHLWVFSNNMNPKIFKQDLHDALLNDGSATSVNTDDKTKHIFYVGSNDGLEERKIKTNLHLATLKV